MAIVTKTTGIAEYGQYMKVLFCGDPGAGKTLTASTFPNPFFISAEGGLMSIARRFLPYAELQTTDDLKEILKILRQTPEARGQMLNAPGRIDTIVIDTLDEVQKLFMKERVATKKDEAFVLKDFGWLREKMEGAIRAFRNLPINVVFTCHLKENRDEEVGSVAYLPGLVGASAAYIPGAVDLSLVLLSRTEASVVDGKTQKQVVRYAQTYRDAKYPWVKDRSGRLPQEFAINFEDDYDRMFDAIYGGIDDEFAALLKANNIPLPKKRTLAATPDPLAPEGDDIGFEEFAKDLQATKA